MNTGTNKSFFRQPGLAQAIDNNRQSRCRLRKKFDCELRIETTRLRQSEFRLGVIPIRGLSTRQKGAITLDPQNAEAMVGLAYARGRATFYAWSTAAEDKPSAQMELLTKATGINPDYALAYYVKSTVLWLAKEYPEALAAAETVVALDPNSSYGYTALGRTEALLGRCEQSITHTKQAFALNPRDPFSGIWYMHLGLAELCQGRLDAAIEQLKRAIVSGYPTYFTYEPQPDLVA